MDLFKLVGSIFIKSDEANQEIDNVVDKAKEVAGTVGKSMQDVGDKMSSIGTKMLPVTVAIAGVGTASVKASAEVKAMNSQFEQTFGELQSQAKTAMQSVADESGILETRLQGIGTSIYAFAKASGADSAEAMSLMETALKATADASAYYDRSLEDTSESLMSFLKGNYENDSALGLSCTETTRNAEAMELFGKKFNDLSEIQKQQTLLKMVTDAQDLSGAMGQASRESDGFENVTGNLNESVRILSAEMGEVLLPTVINLIQKATAFFQKLSEMDEGTKQLIVTAGLVVGAISPILIVGGKLISGIGSIITNVPTIISGAKTLGTGLQALWGIMSANPVGAIITIIGALIAIFATLWNTSDEFRAFWIELWDNIKSIVSTVVDSVVTFLSDAWNNIKTTAESVFNGIKNFLSDTWNSIKTNVTDVFNGIKDFLSDVWDGIKNVVEVAIMFIVELVESAFDLITLPFRFIWENCKETVIEIWDGIKETVSNAFTAVKDKVSEIGGNVKDKCSEVFDNIKDKVSTAWDNIKTKTTDAWNDMKVSYEEGGGGIAGITEVYFDTVKNTVCNVLDAISEFTGINLDGLKTLFTDVWTNIRDTVVDILNKLQTGISEVWEAITSWLSTKFEEIKQLSTDTWNSIKTFVSDTLNNLKTAISNGMEAIKTTLTNVWNAVKSATSSAWDGIKSTVSNAISNVKSSITSGLDNVKSKVSSVLDNVKSKFKSIFDNAKNIVKDSLDKIKSYFNGLKLEFPKIKLPHFKITGKFSIDPPSVPKLTIEWYKKAMDEPYMFTKPTLFDYDPRSGLARGAGEAGAEVMIGKNTMLNMIGQAVAQQNNNLIGKLQEAMERIGDMTKSNADGEIIIPIYLGNKLIDELVIDAKKRINMRSGGMVSV